MGYIKYAEWCIIIILNKKEPGICGRSFQEEVPKGERACGSGCV